MGQISQPEPMFSYLEAAFSCPLFVSENHSLGERFKRRFQPVVPLHRARQHTTGILVNDLRQIGIVERTINFYVLDIV